MTKLTVETACLASLFLLEGFIPFFTGRGLRSRVEHLLLHLSLGLLNSLAVFLFFSFLTASVLEWSQRWNFGLVRWLGLPGWASTVVALVLFDGWMYFWHRANHEVRFLWSFHRTHHTDLNMDASSALRFHTGEILMSSAARLLVVPLLGLDFSQLVLYEVLLQPVILLHHSNVALPGALDRALSFFIITPNLHRVHHSQVRAETNSNYSTVLPVWDRLFGSFRRREDPHGIAFGIPEMTEERWQKLPGMMATPFVDPERPA